MMSATMDNISSMCSAVYKRQKLHRVPLTTYVLDLWPEHLYSVMPVRNKALRAVAAGVSHWFYPVSYTHLHGDRSGRAKAQRLAHTQALRRALFGPYAAAAF